MEIKVLGPGCARCEKTARRVADALQEAGIEARVEKVTDMMQIAAHGVVATPAVLVNGEVKSTGRVPSKADVLGWLR